MEGGGQKRFEAKSRILMEVALTCPGNGHQGEGDPTDAENHLDLP